MGYLITDWTHWYGKRRVGRPTEGFGTKTITSGGKPLRKYMYKINHIGKIIQKSISTWVELQQCADMSIILTAYNAGKK